MWALRELVSAGYDAVLLEAEAIGAGQSMGAQGILHGGVKYGLDGSNRDIAARLRSLPPIWHGCMAGTRSPELREARVLSPVQYLWAADSWLARVGATIGARAMQGEVRKLEKAEWPAPLRAGGHKGSVFCLEETVLEVKTVFEALVAPVRDRIFLGKVDGYHSAGYQGDGTGGLTSVTVGDVTLSAEVFLFTAAAGNEAAAAGAGFAPEVAQRRPLKQVMVKGLPEPIYGHCVTATPKPVVTITAHPMDGQWVWYLGGGVAEEATHLEDGAAIRLARKTLQEVFPQLSWSNLEWSCWAVDRAEPHATNRLPDGPALLERGNTALAWPTKLVYAPELARQAVDFVRRKISPGNQMGDPVPLPAVPMGRYPWEEARWELLP